MKIQKKLGVWLEGGGCEQRSEAFVKIKKKIVFWGVGGRGVRWGGGGGGVRVDVNEEVSFCENSKKKFFFFFWGGVGLGWGGGVSDQGWGGGGGSKVWGRWVM